MEMPPIPLRLLLAAQPELITTVLQMVQRVVTRHLLNGVGLKGEEGHAGTVTLIQCFGSAANLNFPCTACCWTGFTGAVPLVCRYLSKPVRPLTTNCTRCCRRSLPG